MGTGIIVTFVIVTVGSAVAQKIMESTGHTTEAQFLDTTTKAGLAVTCLSFVAKAVTEFRKMGA